MFVVLVKKPGSKYGSGGSASKKKRKLGNYTCDMCAYVTPRSDKLRQAAEKKFIFIFINCLLDLNKTGLMRFWQINKCVTDSIEIKDKKENGLFLKASTSDQSYVVPECLTFLYT